MKVAAALIACVATTLVAGQAIALDGKDYAGTWTGKLKGGQTIELDIPANVDKGGTVTYAFNGQTQASQKPTVVGNKISLPIPRRRSSSSVQSRARPYHMFGAMVAASRQPLSCRGRRPARPCEISGGGIATRARGMRPSIDRLRSTCLKRIGGRSAVTA